MKRVFLTGVFLASVTASFGQYPYGGYGDRGYGRDRDYRDDRGYGNYGRGGYGSRNGSPVSRVLGTLDRIDSRAWVDNHERDHFARARNELYNFETRWQQGRFETRYLDRAIDEMKHLANARQLNPRDRDVVRRSIDELRAFRSSGGYYRR